MVRVALLLLIVGGVAVFTLQNLSPIGLVILGIRTQALPLAFWVVGSLIAGALTTLFLTGLSSLSRSTVRRSGQRVDEPSGSARSPWSAAGANRESKSTRTRNSAGFSAASAGSRRTDDDWEGGDQEAWEDWGEPEPVRQSAPETRTEVRDTADDDWANWEGYEERLRNSRRPVDRATDRTTPPPRTEFEVKRPPAARQQSGSVYSYRYDDAKDRPTERKTTERKPKEVYDAEYRVLIPPYNPESSYNPEPPYNPESPFTPEPSYTPEPEPLYTPEPQPPVTNTDDDDDDWGLDDDLEDKKR